MIICSVKYAFCIFANIRHQQNNLRKNIYIYIYITAFISHTSLYIWRWATYISHIAYMSLKRRAHSKIHFQKYSKWSEICHLMSKISKMIITTKLHIMMTSSNGNIFTALVALCAGNSPVISEFPAHRPVTRSFDVFLDLRLNKRLSKQSWDWWFETPSRPLWRHRNVYGCKP